MNDSDFNSAIIIYQMGKVGSTTVHESLKSAGLATPIYKVHFLSDEGMKRGHEFHQQTLKKPWVTTPHIETSQFLRQAMSRDPGIRWKIITLVREPISREVSEFFQYVNSLYPDIVDQDGRLDEARALKILHTKFMFYKEAKSYTCTWFDVEFKGLFGLDVYAHPFQHRQGFTILHHGNIDVLILRMEDLDRALGRGLAQFLDLEAPVEMVRSNVRLEREHGTAYRQVLKDIVIPRPLCRKVYSTRYATHFYTPDEIEAFTKKWSGE